MSNLDVFTLPSAHLEVVLLEEVDEGDEGGPPHHEGGVAQARSDLRQQGVHQRGVPIVNNDGIFSSSQHDVTSSSISPS